MFETRATERFPSIINGPTLEQLLADISNKTDISSILLLDEIKKVVRLEINRSVSLGNHPLRPIEMDASPSNSRGHDIVGLITATRLLCRLNGMPPYRLSSGLFPATAEDDLINRILEGTKEKMEDFIKISLGEKKRITVHLNTESMPAIAGIDSQQQVIDDTSWASLGLKQRRQQSTVRWRVTELPPEQAALPPEKRTGIWASRWAPGGIEELKQKAIAARRVQKQLDG